MRENKSALDGIGEEKTEINLLVPEVLMIIALNAMIFFLTLLMSARRLDVLCFPLPLYDYYVFVFFPHFSPRFCFSNAHVFVPDLLCFRTFA